MAITINKPVEVERTEDNAQIQHLICDFCYPMGSKRVKAKCGMDDLPGYTPNATEKCLVCLEMEGKPCPYCGQTPNFTIG